MSDLPCVQNDLTELAAALEVSGYQVDTNDVSATGLNRVNTRIERFIAGAKRDDMLLIYLSGHGVHHGGDDRLVPSDADTMSKRFYDQCVRINFNADIDDSLASQALVLVDACREGFDDHVKNVGARTRWATSKIDRVSGRRLAYVFACSPGQVARFVHSESETFSIFSRALSRILRGDGPPLTLAALQDALQDEIGRLADFYRIQPQTVRVLGETRRSDFYIIPHEGLAAESKHEHPWIVAAREHAAWEQASGGPGATAIRDLTLQTVKRLADTCSRERRLVPDDPWFDPGFSMRMSERMGFMLKSVLDERQLALSPAEAALLVVMPYAQEAFWTRQAAKLRHIGPVDLTVRGGSRDRISYERYAFTYSRLVRRAAYSLERGDRTSAAGIGWWLFHRWLVRSAELYEPRVVADLLGPGALNLRLTSALFDAQSVLEMIRALGDGPGSVARLGQTPNSRFANKIAASTVDEQPLRRKLVAYLLALAHGLAIDPAGLPEVVVSHLGIVDSVSLSDVRSTVGTAEWRPRGMTRVLAANCTHPCMHVALQEHTVAIDTLLSNVHASVADDIDLVVLRTLPAHASADGVGPGTTADGVRYYDSAGVRFRLADDRIQELLMGEQLYGDPALAVRELYQNALDACRYAEARRRYLQRIGKPAAPWKGDIQFREGVDEAGRRFLECRDNGVGMGFYEIIEAFSHAGVRFSDLPEFLNEQSDWENASPPVRFFPNSRFGIGVLSYFMLADDITLRTCRLNRNGQPGHELTVNIAGPGALFRVRDSGPGLESGTTIRLYLRPGLENPFCVALLRRLLWLADYQVEA
ncbi:MULTISPECIES: caspase family protein, partial [unclassified Frankia]|uniref:HD domain-containing protein n=1 Tax=unclassified Frankia TaxID=2632575 RepID=UPI002AD52F88